MCLGQIGNLLPHVAVAAILAQHLMPAWHLSASLGGLMASGYAFGYMVAVPVLTPLTDRVDARRVLLLGSIVSGLATLAFGFFAAGFWSALLIWTIAGIGFAGAYMPGLKGLLRSPSAETERIGHRRKRLGARRLSASGRAVSRWPALCADLAQKREVEGFRQ
jgi:MFS family permease